MKENDSKRSDRIFFIIAAVYIAVCAIFIVIDDMSRNTGYVTIEEMEQKKEEAAAAAIAEKTVNINTATLEELMTLNGIGKATAEKIIEYRENNNGFLTVDELLNVNGIGEAKLEKIRMYLTVGDEGQS